MSNGGEEYREGRRKADEFARAVSKMAVAQICESLGFHGCKDSALDALTEIAIRYLCDLGKTASFYANLSGRTQCNVFDIVRSFEDVGASQGFLGASDTAGCLVSSGTVKELSDFVFTSEEIPFAQPIPSFPIVRERKLIPSFESMNETPSGKHIPNWLPAFPDPHTYLHTPMWNERVPDPRAEKIEQARQRRKAERALLSLQQRLMSNGFAGPSSSRPSSSGGGKELGVVVKSNPHLAAPMEAGEKDVSVVALPNKLSNHVSVMDAFAPVIDTAKESGLSDDGDIERKLLPEKRPVVNFSIKARKKLLGEHLDVSLSKKGGERSGHWLGRDDERDDKKRRAEYILRQSMENPQELNQL